MVSVLQKMGYDDRDYHRSGPSRPVSRFADIPVVKWLLISNAAIFLITTMIRTDPRMWTSLELFGFFSIETGFGQFQVWRLLTFQFLHAGFMHLAFNMWALYIFGPFLERWLRSRAFLFYYLLSGIGGALLYTLFVYAPGILPGGMVGDQLVGASAGIFGLLVGVAILAPQGVIRLIFPPIAMKMRTFALLYLGLEVYLVLTNSSNAGGSAGHLGGALVGVLLMKLPAGRGLLVRVANSGGGVKLVAKPKRRPESKLRPRSGLSGAEASEVDLILEKISKEGLHSLTDKGRELLRKVSGK